MAKVVISLPDDLLQRIDREVNRRNTTRSAFLQHAAQRELGCDAVGAAIKRGRAALTGMGRFDSAQLIRTDRDEREARDRRR